VHAIAWDLDPDGHLILRPLFGGIVPGLAAQVAVAVEYGVSSTAPSYTAQCLELAQQKVDYVQLDVTTAAAVRFIQNCQSQGYNPTWDRPSSPSAPASPRSRTSPSTARRTPSLRSLTRLRSPRSSGHAEVRFRQQQA
jgi:hypothetical protein